MKSLPCLDLMADGFGHPFLNGVVCADFKPFDEDFEELILPPALKWILAFEQTPDQKTLGAAADDWQWTIVRNY